jgi:hypothetical protein
MTFGHWAVWEFTPHTPATFNLGGTVWLVRAAGKDPLDKPVTTVLIKDHLEGSPLFANSPFPANKLKSAI